MCGRYYVGEKFIEDVKASLPALAGSLEYDYCGDITPAMRAPVIAGRNDTPVLEQMTWGFHKFDGKGLIINARSETATEKSLFRECVQNRRILIPASRFYEWDKEKNKVTFTLDNHPVLFLAGFYERTEDAPDGRFVILTTAANSSMSPVHDRMPLMIMPEKAHLWLCDRDEALAMLHKEMPLLTAERDYEQQSFL